MMVFRNVLLPCPLYIWPEPCQDTKSVIGWLCISSAASCMASNVQASMSWDIICLWGRSHTAQVLVMLSVQGTFRALCSKLVQAPQTLDVSCVVIASWFLFCKMHELSTVPWTLWSWSCSCTQISTLSSNCLRFICTCALYCKILLGWLYPAAEVVRCLCNFSASHPQFWVVVGRKVAWYMLSSSCWCTNQQEPHSPQLLWVGTGHWPWWCNRSESEVICKV